MIKKKTVKSRVPKPYNNGTMSQAALFSMIRSLLRKGSMYWKPIAQAKKDARRAVIGKGNQKWEYQCNHCKGWFMDKEIAVDHLIEAGEVKSWLDVGLFAERLFVEKNLLQVLCNKRNDCEPSCHKKKTDAYMKGKKK